ncbi:MAG: CBS and ACT domain-containing protein [Treponema sp.]|nr:CBS and ACT domain-containing protein [Treponema sp.]
MLIKNVMTKNPITITPESSVTEARALMNKNNIGKLPVVDKNFKLVGMVTKNDLAKCAPSQATTLDMYEISYLLSKLTVEKIMVKNVFTVQDTDVVENAAKLMLDNGIGCVPVMSGDLIVGILTESDLFALFTEMFGANRSGIRVIFSLDDTPGQLAKIVDQIANKNGNLVSLVTRELKDSSMRRVTMKIAGITKSCVEEIFSAVGVKADDIRVN